MRMRVSSRRSRRTTGIYLEVAGKRWKSEWVKKKNENRKILFISLNEIEYGWLFSAATSNGKDLDFVQLLQLLLYGIVFHLGGVDSRE